MRLKAFRGLAAAVIALFAATGCETDGETVPVRTTGPLPPATTEARPVLVASAAETPTPVKVDKPAAAAELTTNEPAALTTAEATAKAAAEVGVTNIPPSAVAAATANAPAITEEIPPARPGNLKISESTEKVLKLTESNLDEKVILTFVQQTPTKFDLDADEIVYLSDVGVPPTVIAAMLKHDGDDPSKAENITAAANTENVQPAIAQNLPRPGVVQLPGAPPPPPQGQAIEVTTNYVPNQQVIVQQAPQTVVVEQQPTVVYAQPETVTYFYDSLSPYGSWFYVSDYGWCWQPTVAVVDHGWRPYGPRGHWVWTDSGWYWASDYSWGWAPFHYGRWHMHGARGWVWVPDHTWGPAWVTWRSYGDYCGWAPLPPAAVFSPGFGFTYFGRGVDISFGFGLGYDAFCFAPVNRFHYRRVYDYCLPRHETVRVYAHSHVANHWEFGRGEHAFVNRSGARLETGARPAVVRTMSDNDRSRWGNRERVERGARETVIYRPPSPPATTAPRVASGDRSGRTAPGATPTWSPRTRAEVASRPSTASGIAAPAGQPNSIDSRRFDRGSSDRVEGRPQVSTRPSEVVSQPAPTQAGAPQVVNPATRGVGRGQITGLPAPSTTTPSPTTGGPAPSTSTPGIGNTANTASRITPPTTVAPPPVSRSVNREPQVFNPRRSIAEAEPVTTPVPEPAPSRRSDFPRTITTPTTPAPAPTTVTPNVPTTISPRTVAPPPQTVAPSPRSISPPPETVAPAPRIISPPPSSASPTRISPSAPTYSAPTYTPPMRGNVSAPAPAPSAPVSRAPVIQAPSSRGGEPNRAGNPNTVSPDRRGGRGRD